MANVTIDADRVLNRLDLDSDDIPKIKVETFITDAIVTVENELGVAIGELAGDAGSKSISVLKKYAPVITNLADCYCICFMTGGSAVGLSMSMGDVRVEALSEAPSLVFLRGEVERAINKEASSLREIAFVVGEDTS